MREQETKTVADASKGHSVRGTTFALRVSEGPDAGLSIVLDGGAGEARVLVGQSAVCQLRLTDPTVSRRHVALRREDHAWRLEDLGSTNGTRVNGVLVKEAFLTGGEVVSVGSSSFRLTRVGVAPPASVSPDAQFGGFLGVSEEVRRQYGHWASLASSALNLLVEGESGVGKELLCEALHDRSARAQGPFVILTAAQVTADNLQAMLHGSEGGDVEQTGVFEQANGGTLVIDEPADLDAAAQAQLAAILERGEVTLAGSGRRARVDVRVLTTSRRDLDQEVQAGRFREDLLYRLAGATIQVPPLRHRREDVTPLARYFWQRLGGAGELPAEIVASVEGYEWPGNVRELLNLVAERLAVGAEAARLAAARDPHHSTPPPSASADDAFARVIAMQLPYARAREEILREFERRYTEATLAQHGGNVSRAAAASGLARRYFQLLRARHR